MSETLDMVAKLEPDALKSFALSLPQNAALCSIAISLKRIADMMEQRNDYGEQGAEAIEGAIRRGIQGIES